ncbi:MAG: hypothetical protein DCC75_01485, partial [Proteobacteria bacterium]
MSDLSAIESLVIVIGVSGAGKSLAIDALSDLGFFTVENLPVPLFQQFLNFIGSEPARFSKVALTLDIDSRDKQAVLFEMLKLATPRPGRLQ